MKIIETNEVSNISILSDTGFEPMTHTHKTIKYPVYKVDTIKYSFRAADHHKVFIDGKEISVADLKPGDAIETVDGTDYVTSICGPEESEHMYSPTVDSEKHAYFANGVLHKNTTIVAIYGLYYTLFNKDKTVAVLANKMQGAIEIVDRIKVLMEGLPDFLKPGIKSYNKKSIEFENGCKIIAAATSPSAVRGLTINCLAGDNIVEVKDNVTGEIKAMSLSELKDDLQDANNNKL
jgi:hypothetical protein